MTFHLFVVQGQLIVIYGNLCYCRSKYSNIRSTKQVVEGERNRLRNENNNNNNEVLLKVYNIRGKKLRIALILHTSFPEVFRSQAIVRQILNSTKEPTNGLSNDRI